MTSIDIYTIDAFTDTPFKGNPAGVCITQKSLADDLMQNIATEMNLSETAFVVPFEGEAIQNASTFSLRWFTPTNEVDLCGHGTLAASHALFHEHMYAKPSITFKTKSGDLITTRLKELYIMDFPQGKPFSVEIPAQIPEIFNIEAASINNCHYSTHTGNLILEFSDEELVESANPNITKMMDLEVPFNLFGILITAKSASPTIDFKSRCFFPWDGIIEDPVTGSAHTDLAPYWSDKLKKNNFRAFQASQRGGIIEIELIENGRILLMGKAITVLRGKFAY